MDLNIRVAEETEEQEGTWEWRSKRLEMLMKTLLYDNSKVDKLLDPGLHEAAREGDADNFIDVLEQVSVRKRLSLSVIFNQVGPSGNSLLHVAASSGNEEIVELIAYHFPLLVSQRNLKGDTALHIAARIGKLNMIEILVSRGKDLSDDSTDIGYPTQYSTSKKLLTMKNVHGNTCLHEAVRNCHYNVVQFLISADPILCCFMNKEGWSPLYMAVKTGNLQILRLLLQATAKVGESFQRMEGNSPAHAAVLGSRLDMLEEMAKESNGELFRIKDGKGRTVLHWAARMGELDAVRILLSQSRQSMFEMDSKGSLPIHLASRRGHVEVIKEFLKHWPDPTELLNMEGQNILHAAAKNGKVNVVTYILENPTLEKLLNDKDINGNTPLHLAAIHPHPHVVIRLTRDNRINVKILNNDSLTARDVGLVGFNGNLQHIMTYLAFYRASFETINWDLKVHHEQTAKKIIGKPVAKLMPKKVVFNLLIMQTLMATVTFTAGCTLPGGYNIEENPDKGTATLLDKKMFQFFVICDTAAFYSSIMGIMMSFWIELGDQFLVGFCFLFSIIAYAAAALLMCLAFAAAIHIAISKLLWLSSIIIIMDFIVLGFIVLEFMIWWGLTFPVFSVKMFTLNWYYCFSKLMDAILVSPYSRLFLNSEE